MGLPGAWTVLLLRAVVVHPAGCGLPSPCCGETAVAFGVSNPLGTRNDIVFIAAFPTAHTLARLRIAGRVAASVARLATGWAGSPFAGRGLHPLDDEPQFMSIIAPLIPFGPALPGRTALPTRRKFRAGLRQDMGIGRVRCADLGPYFAVLQLQGYLRHTSRIS